jgi:hypothetical protein
MAAISTFAMNLAQILARNSAQVWRISFDLRAPEKLRICRQQLTKNAKHDVPFGGDRSLDSLAQSFGRRYLKIDALTDCRERAPQARHYRFVQFRFGHFSSQLSDRRATDNLAAPTRRDLGEMSARQGGAPGSSTGNFGRVFYV